MKSLIDTNILINFLRGIDTPELVFIYEQP